MSRFNVLPTGRGKSVLASYIFNLALPAGILSNILEVKVRGVDPTLYQVDCRGKQEYT